MSNLSSYLHCTIQSIKNNLDTSIAENKRGLYLFSKPITDSIIKNIKANPRVSRTLRKPIFAYYADSMELVNGTHFSTLLEASKFFKCREKKKTIASHVGTFKASLREGKYAYLFESDISVVSDIKQKLLTRPNLVKPINRTIFIQPVWVYRKTDQGTLVPLNDNKPTFRSLTQAEQELNISRKSIQRRMESGSSQKAINNLLFFYSEL